MTTDVVQLRHKVLNVLNVANEVSESLSNTHDRLRCSVKFYIFDDEKKEPTIGKKVPSVTWYFQLNKVNLMRVFMPQIPELLEEFSHDSIESMRVNFGIGMDKTLCVTPIEQHVFNSCSAPIIIKETDKEVVAMFVVYDITPDEELVDGNQQSPKKHWGIVACINKRTKFINYFDIQHNPEDHVALTNIFKKEAHGFAFPIAKDIVIAAMKQLNQQK